MNKKISIQNIYAGVQEAWQRFPFACLLAFVGTVVGMFLVQYSDSDFLPSILCTILLGFLLCIAGAIFTEEKKSRTKTWLTFSGIFIFLACHIFFFDKEIFHSHGSDIYEQYALWVIGAFILCMLVPFIQKSQDRALSFWIYTNKILRALITTVVYAAAIFVGLAIALASVQFLFDLNIDGEWWIRLWIIIVGVFAPLFFFARYPKIEVLEEQTTYPKELKIFTHYILAPLVGIYFLILYSYTAKILITGEWPNGMVSSMILGFSTLGLCTYLLMYPLVLKDKILHKISNVFFIALVPQFGVLFWAIWLRVSQYGITEIRYVLIGSSLWIVGVSLYLLLSKTKNICRAAISLFLVIVLATFGPWSMFAVSKHSQSKRLEMILQQDHLLVDGHIDAHSVVVDIEDQVEIYKIITYLYDSYGKDAIQQWFLEELNQIDDQECYMRSYVNDCSVVSKALSGTGIMYMQNSQKSSAIYFSPDKDVSSQNIQVTDYDYMLNDQKDFDIVGDHYNLVLDNKAATYTMYKNKAVLSTFSLREFADELSKKYAQGVHSASVKDMTFVHEDDKLKIKIYFSTIVGDQNGVSGEGITLVKIK